MRKFSYEQPKIIASMPPDMLQKIHRAIPNRKFEIYWGSPNVTPLVEKELFKPIEPFHKLVVAKGRLEKDPFIHYSVDTRDIGPGKTQRDGVALTWHVDGTRGFMLSNVTTEFMVLDPKYENDRDRRIRRQRLAVEDAKKLPDEELESYGLGIYSPPPFALIALKLQLHRSPRNATGKRIKRTWLRALVM